MTPATSREPLATDAQRLSRLNALLAVALDLPEHELDPWLQSLPPDAQAFVPMLKALLTRASVETDTFMRQPIAVAAGAIDALDATADRPIWPPWRNRAR
jgi:hypothetical protein